MYGVRQVLNLIQAGQSLDAAMQAKLSLSYDKFQQQWAERLRADLKSGKS
jgi:type II secretory pathway component PulF